MIIFSKKNKLLFILLILVFVGVTIYFPIKLYKQAQVTETDKVLTAYKKFIDYVEIIEAKESNENTDEINKIHDELKKINYYLDYANTFNLRNLSLRYLICNIESARDNKEGEMKKIAELFIENAFTKPSQIWQNEYLEHFEDGNFSHLTGFLLYNDKVNSNYSDIRADDLVGKKISTINKNHIVSNEEANLIVTLLNEYINDKPKLISQMNGLSEKPEIMEKNDDLFLAFILIILGRDSAINYADNKISAISGLADEQLLGIADLMIVKKIDCQENKKLLFNLLDK